MAEKVLKTVIQVRRGTTAEWEQNKTYVPYAGEPCLDMDTGAVKYGDGTTAYESLKASGAFASHYEGVRTKGGDGSFTETDAEVIERVLSEEGVTPGKDDIFVVKAEIADGKYSYTAYVYDGAVWAAMDGNYSAENVYFPNDLTLTYAFGKYTPSNGKVSVPAGGMNLSGLFTDAFAEDLNPDVTQPSVTLTSSEVKAYEVGTEVTPSYTAVFNPGSYEYDETTGVTVQSWEVTDTNGGAKTTDTGTFDTFTVTDDTSYSITAKANYGDGAIPKTALGNDYAAGQIKAGSKSATKGTVTGYRNTFYGAVSDKTGTVDSAAVRALTKSNKALADGAKFTISAPVGTERIIIAYPASLRDITSVLDVNGMNAEIKSSFTKSTVSVEGANSAAGIDYKVYVMDSVPLDTANTFAVTI